MPPIILWVISAGLLLLFLGAVVWFAFWMIAKAAPAEPARTIISLIVLIVGLIILFFLAYSMGVPPGIK